MNSLAHQYAQVGSSGSHPDADNLLRAHVIDTATMAIKARESAGLITGEQGSELLIGFRQRADAADAYRDIDTNPAAALEKLQNEANYPNLDEYRRAILISRAENRAREAEAQAQGSVRERYSRNVDALQTTGAPAVPLSDGEVKNAFPDSASDMLHTLSLAKGLWHANAAITLSSPEQDQALLRGWQPPPGAGIKEGKHAEAVMTTALRAKYEALKRDPAAYVLQVAPGISAQFDAASKDPTQLKPALAALDGAYDRLGLAAADRHVMSGDMAQTLAQSIAADPMQARAKLDASKQQYGNYWPRAWHDLTTLGKLPASYQALDVLDGQRDQAQLARWLGEQPKGKAVGDLLGEKAVSGIKSAVRSDPGVQALTLSLSRSGASTAQTQDVLDSVDNLAFANSYFDHDPHAAHNAVQSFTSKYEFMPNGGARVPREHFADVQTNAANTLDGLALGKIAVPEIYGKPGMPSPDEYLDQLKAAPTWITSPRADALWLMDTSGRLVRDKRGAPIAVPFAARPPAGADQSWWSRMAAPLPGGAAPL